MLRDGGTAHLRPIVPADADPLRRFHSRLSDDTIYNRFFTLYRSLTDRDVDHFTNVDHDDRAALVATVGDELIGVVRYERTGPDEAEVAFNIEDAHQGRGLGTVFLEHIAAAARERGISRFVADVLPSNSKMLRVFSDAGYVVDRAVDDGVARLAFDLEPTEDSLTVTYAREHRAEARSVQRLLEPTSVAVVGAGRDEASLGHTVLCHVRDAGFTGELYAVNPHADEVAGVRSYATVRDIPSDVDLAVIAVPAEEVEGVVADCATKGVRGLVVMSSGFAEAGAGGSERQLRLVALARGGGMRVLGPSSLGVINTDPGVRLNASLSPLVPDRGRVGFFSQSGALGIALLDNAVRRGLGLSTFVSAGNRVDVSGNDLLQHWEDDEATDVVMLYLESLGNPRKFSRIARRISRRKPVVVVKSGRSVRRGGVGVPHGHLVRHTQAPAAAVDALFTRAGVMRVGSIHEMFDVAQLVANQPLPGGVRVGLVGNSDALALLAADACEEAGLEVVSTATLGADSSPGELEDALTSALDDDGVDSVVALFIPPLRTRDAEVGEVLARTAGPGRKTVVATFLGMPGVPEALCAPDGGGCVPSYATPEDAVRALAAVTTYATWRRTPAGHTVVPSGLEVRAARELVADLLGDGDEVVLDEDGLTRLLGFYGIELWPTVAVASADEAVAAAGRLGHPVALKALAQHLRHRRELGGVRLDIDDADELRGAFGALRERLGDVGPFGVQRMAPTGVACWLATVEDPLFGPVISFGLGGVVSDLLGDRSYGVPPLTDSDLFSMVRSVRAAPMLQGYAGSEPVDLAALEDLLARLARLADDVPEVALLELTPVVASPTGAAVLGATGRLARPTVRAERAARALSR